MKSVKSKFILKIVSISNLPEVGGFYRIEWKRSSTTGRTQTFVANQKADASVTSSSPRSSPLSASPRISSNAIVRHNAELVDEENIVFDLITTQDQSRQFSKKEMSFALKVKEGAKSRLVGTCDINLSDYIAKSEAEPSVAEVDVPFTLTSPSQFGDVVLRLRIETSLCIKKKDGLASSLSSSLSEHSESEVDEVQESPRKTRHRLSGLRSPRPTQRLVVQVCRITGLVQSKFQPHAHFFVKCRGESSTLGMTTPIGPLIDTELAFEPPQEMTLQGDEKDKVTFAIYSQLAADKDKPAKEKPEAFAKAKLCLGDYFGTSMSISSPSLSLTNSAPNYSQPTRVVLSCVQQKDTIEGMLW